MDDWMFFGSQDAAANAANAERQEENKIVQDSSSQQLKDLASKLGMTLDSSTVDYLTQYYLNERSNQNAFNRSMEASNTQYQRTVKDLQKAGLNPFLAMQSLGGSAPSSSGSSVQGGLYTSRKNQESGNDNKILSTVLGILAGVALAMM